MERSDPGGTTSREPPAPGGKPAAQAPLAHPPARLTSRAAVLAVVICAIALSLAYPVREYVAQRRQIDELVAEQQMMQAQYKNLIAQRDMYANPAYIEQTAEQELHMCLPAAKCYVIDNGQSVIGLPRPTPPPSAPWYAKVWHSVQQADATTPPTVSATPAAGAVTSAPASSAPASSVSPAPSPSGTGSGTR
jgi:cell division protein FtsL